MKSKEEIIKEHIPNGIVNVKGKGDGKPQYKAEIDIIQICMEEYAQQFKDGQRTPADDAASHTKEARSEALKNLWQDIDLITDFADFSDAEKYKMIEKRIISFNEQLK